jgi:mono/diheme cytochrome c family protein
VELRPDISRRPIWIAVALAGLLLAVLAVRWLPALYWTWRTDNPVRRGAALAAKQGCLSCHAPLGRDETANPGSRWGSVPSFFRGNAAMYVRSAEQVRNFIAFGSADRTVTPEHEAVTSGDQASPRPPFHMLAFGGRLSHRDIDALAAFVLAADGYLVPTEGSVARGAEVSTKLGCEGCHGVAGAGGIHNPRSFTGAVPGWTGTDFDHLVSGESEFRQWVLEGRSDRWRRNWLASRFLDRANLQMPAFAGAASDRDVSDLWAYVQWLRSHDGDAAFAGR